MEYDRALYRVYERVMEDLCSTPSPLSPSPSQLSATHATANNATADVPPSAAASTTTDVTGGGDPSAAVAADETRRRQRGRGRDPLPFCIPVSMVTTTAVIGRRFVPLWAFGVYHRVRALLDREYGYEPLPVLPTYHNTRSSSAGSGGEGVTSGNGVSPPPSLPEREGEDGGSAAAAPMASAATMRYRYHRRAMEHHRGNAARRETPPSSRSASSERRRDRDGGGGGRNRRRMRITGDELIALMEGDEIVPENGEARTGGLFHRGRGRRRPRDGEGGESQSDESSSSDEDSEGSYEGHGDSDESDFDSHSSSSDAGEGNDDDGVVVDATNSPPGSPAEGRRRRRRRGRGRSSRRRRDAPGFGGDVNPNPFAHSRTSSEESEEEGEEVVVGCTQKCLYKLLQLSLLVGTFHIYVIWALHSTYVMPGIVGRGRGWWYMGLGGEDGDDGITKVRPSWAEVHAAYDEEWRVANAATAAADAVPKGVETSLAASGAEGSEEENPGRFPSRLMEDEGDLSGTKEAEETASNGLAEESTTEPKRPARKKKTTRGPKRPSSASTSAKVLRVPDLDYYMGGTCIERALSTGGRRIEFEYNRTVAKNSTDDTANSTTATANVNVTDSTTNSTTNPSALPTNHSGGTTRWEFVGGGNWTALPLLRHDEILQIKILYGGSCLAGSCSRVHNVSTTTASNSTTHSNGGVTTNATLGKGGDYDGGEYVSSKDLESAEFWEKPHYRYATDEALLFLDKDFLLKHGVNVVNVTVTERCLSTGSDSSGADFLTKSAEIFSQVYGMDSAVINQLMYGIRDVDGGYRNGYVQNMETDERWSWRKEFLQESAKSHTNVFVWLGNKIGTIFLSFLAFFLVTSVTALIVRVLTSSGVVLMFPIFACFRAMGLPGADDRILGLSYPWIGRARWAVMRRRIHPDSHLIYAHLAKIGLFYIMYEACQAAWSVVLYGKSIPEGLPIWLYGFCMIWEYFSMVFVRSALSAYFFPRITLLYFLVYHFYFYSVPYGYFDVALIPLFFFMIQAMFYTILALEVPAASRGAISIDCPREVYNRLSWPAWTAALPHEWTLFLPLNSRYIPLHDREVSTEGGDRSTTQRGPQEPAIREAAANGGEDQQSTIGEQRTARQGEDDYGISQEEGEVASQHTRNGHHSDIGQRDLHIL